MRAPHPHPSLSVLIYYLAEVDAFDEAVMGADAIEHTASPVHLKANEPDEIIFPAIFGAPRMLESVFAHGSSVKWVVATSSATSALGFGTTLDVFTEENGNEQAMEDPNANDGNVRQYCASKTLAEHAPWESMEKNKDKLG
ncbi:predicted protein, partial [Postia placenta Mad-698-R]